MSSFLLPGKVAINEVNYLLHLLLVENPVGTVSSSRCHHQVTKYQKMLLHYLLSLVILSNECWLVFQNKQFSGGGPAPTT